MTTTLSTTSKVNIRFCVNGYEYLVTCNMEHRDDWDLLDYIFEMSCENLFDREAQRHFRDADDYDENAYKVVSIERAVKKAYEVSYDLIEKDNQDWGLSESESTDPISKITDVEIEVI